jgi:hypothetical protein
MTGLQATTHHRQCGFPSRRIAGENIRERT